MGTMERPTSPEAMKETKIILQFMRHGEKDPNKEEPKKTDEEIRLTEKGRLQAVEKGKTLNPQPEVSMGWGSPKKRTQETAFHSMLANEEKIDPNASLEDMEKIITEEIKVGKKVKEDPRLSFNLSGPEGQEMLAAFKKGEYLQYLVGQSDQRAVDLHDMTSSSYSRYAGNIAEIIDRYSDIGKNFNRVASKSDKYEEFGNQLERYLGSHQGVVEGFVAKVIEKTEGVEQRNEFISSLGGGFKETEGIKVEIANEGENQKIMINYAMNGENKTVEVDKDLLHEIVKDRDDLNKKAEQLLAA
jgi:hypothetical protein